MIAIVDYGAGNIKSLQIALTTLSIESTLTRDETVIRDSNAIILPGVGAFQDAMHQLRSDNLDKILQEQAAAGKPILGICLGMQLFYETSNEGGLSTGLGLIKGKIERINANVKVPHMGWNTLQIRRNKHITTNIPDQTYVYFVHSYYATDIDNDDLIATSQHGENIPALVQHNNIIGMQFHPEKSGDVGMQLIKNFWEMVS
ncbi:imidazole glycerol phosphate synthase subunit HisH [Ornithinibacillus scapharcae]|uniref:imidazole glycerol phosphate synthase subunit HisH n=1 Tax=Ornithinibacillus scapharcae TaxID=1147159 RepID=UPI000225BF3F|nr:imidazole glycerol phosphate synthase subunit HisH [Ornithinibacillus scapharcae]